MQKGFRKRLSLNKETSWYYSSEGIYYIMEPCDMRNTTCRWFIVENA